MEFVCTQYFKLNIDALVLDRNVGLGAIVRDSNCETMLVLHKIQLITRSVELVEVTTLFDITRANEIDLQPLWTEIDSLILWNFLDTWQINLKNEVQLLTDDIRDKKHIQLVESISYS